MQNRTIGPSSGGLPKKLEVGEEFSAYFIPDHEMLAKGDYVRIGSNDTFGSLHWAPKRHIRDALPKIREPVSALARTGAMPHSPPR